MRTLLILFIILAIIICVFSIVYVTIDFIYYLIERRHNTVQEVNINAAGTNVPEGMMLLPVDYAAKSEEVSVSLTEPEPEAEPVAEIDENAVILTKNERKTIDELYEELSKEQKGFFNGLLEYAKTKENAIESRTKTEVRVKAEGKYLIRLTIKRGLTVAKFNLENDLMKQYRKNSAESKIDVKATEIKVSDIAAYDTAKGLIDVAEENNKREIAAAAEARRLQRAEKRRLSREQAAEEN